MRELAWDAKMKEAVQGLIEQGAFLTTKVGDDQNTMAIGWGSIALLGQTGVHGSGERLRYTYQLMEKAAEFTVSIPLTDAMKKRWSIAAPNPGKM